MSSRPKKICRGGGASARSAVRQNLLEGLECRVFLSGSNAIDRLDFGNLAAEAAHQFEPGYSPAQMPVTGTGALSQTYREPVGNGTTSTGGSVALTFTLATDPT